MADAVDQAGRLARPGDVVLLSPGCASFDWYPDGGYPARGDDFRRLVSERLEGAGNETLRSPATQADVDRSLAGARSLDGGSPMTITMPETSSVADRRRQALERLHEGKVPDAGEAERPS